MTLSLRRTRRSVTILTGFLGSGKTSLLRRLLKDERMARTAVIVNEFGEVGLDHLLLGMIDEDTLLLDGGCICCTVRTDFTETLLSLTQRQSTGKLPAFDRVVVETTGLADPLPLLRSLLSDEKVATHYRVQGVITTVDCSLPPTPHDSRPERLRQIALADQLIVTKGDIAGPEAVKRTRETVRSMNANAEIISASDTNRVVEALFDLSAQPAAKRLESAEHDCAGHNHNDEHDESCHSSPHDQVSAVLLRTIAPVPWRDLTRFLRKLAQEHSGSLLRIKGLVDVAESERPVVIHGVQHFLYPETYLDDWPDGIRQTSIVIILERGDSDAIKALFREHVLRGKQTIP